MPLYGNQVPPPSLFPNYPSNQIAVHTAETVLTGQFSQQVQIAANPSAGSSRGIRVVLDFSAAPGAFECDIMESDTDPNSAEYAEVPVGGSITAVNPGSTKQATSDLIPFLGQFCCLYWKTQPANAVTVTARITRV